MSDSRWTQSLADGGALSRETDISLYVPAGSSGQFDR